MAVDSKEKRCSATHQLVPGLPKAMFPDGVIAQSDRQDVAWVYRGITAYTPDLGGTYGREWLIIMG